MTRPRGPLVGGVLAGVLHVVPGLAIVVSGLAAPLWAVLVLGLLWLVGLVLIVVLTEARSWWSLAVPVVTLGLWFAAITAGGAFLGWTA